MLFFQQIKTLFMKAVWQAGLIFLIAVVLGLGFNQFRKERLPLGSQWQPPAVASGETISLAEARELYAAQKAVFVDARSRELFLQAHIKGAFCLPAEAFEEHFFEFLKAVPPQTRIITYCDGEACDSSHDLAKLLKQQGYTHVQVLVNGWTLWQENKLPIEK
ncbi:MAG: rhodanese-like domain-containing protein [Desulfobacteraceae bacterium]|nr:MAG: rhodanese-like domain-containing protein [Desulfobacteraceae bacterium]